MNDPHPTEKVSVQNLDIINTVQSDVNTVSICKHKVSGKIIIHRHANRGKINNFIENYELIDKDYNSKLIPMTLEKAEEILKRLQSGVPYSSIYIFYEDESMLPEEKHQEKSEQEHKYTSTGIKFWRHQQQMMSYKNEEGHSVVSTHISPEGACNLKCPYCSVTYRDTHSRIELSVIKDYVEKLKSRGLKAVILTGGGEPTSYKHFNELVQWLKYDQNLSVALITNGTLAKKVEPKTWAAFSWIRVSINLFNDWENRIGNNFEKESLNEDCTVGCSMVYTVEHESTSEIMTDRLKMFEKVSQIADRLGAKYIRLLPNCLLEQKHLLAQHRALDNTLSQLKDDRFFHQYKIHGAPNSSVCHQAYFRPYLSEEPNAVTGKPGTVYPCDSVVLNDGYEHFAKEYQLCAPEDILDFLDGKIKPKFDPRERCKGCVFTENVNMLEKFKNNQLDIFSQFDLPMVHEEFI
jgi:MoaA/NifB/PqqE/SkfB family radical SAM enzyme